MIGAVTNRPRFKRFSGSIHAEKELMRRYGSNLKTIVICRINNKGTLKKIDPCQNCAEKAKELGIKIISIQEVV